MRGGIFDNNIKIPPSKKTLVPLNHTWYGYTDTDLQQDATKTDTPFHSFYQTNTNTDIWFGIQIKLIPRCSNDQHLPKI